MKTITITDAGKKTTSEMMNQLKKKFDVDCYWTDEQLDKEFPKAKSKRDFKLEQECSDFKGKSWNEMDKTNMMTFREYILFFEAYHKETGEYPDKAGWTLLKYKLSDGNVADGSWNPGNRRVRFYWYGPDYRYSCSGARVAISLDTESIVPLSLELAIEQVKEAGYIIYKEI